MASGTTFDVGGVLLARPFQLRRLGHFGVNVADSAAGLEFYTRVLGFRRSDSIDFGAMVPPERRHEVQGSGLGHFLRHGTEHHSYVVFPRSAFEAATTAGPAEVTANQLTWQVGSLEEVRAATDWFEAEGQVVARAGRDMPGSNWHVYLVDPDGHVNELYYGIEQIGWSGHTKPPPMYQRIFHEAPSLPQACEEQEVTAAMAAGVLPTHGNRHVEVDPFDHDVAGVLLPRPFKVTRIGPIALFVSDLARSLEFYRDVLGLRLTERTTVLGHGCAHLRAGTEHHSLSLLPLELRGELDLSPHTTLGPIGLQVASYRQLDAARRWLAERGHATWQLPADLHPGIGHALCTRDTDGHTLELYASMEQIGWDGRPRPSEQRPPIPLGWWPEHLSGGPELFDGEPFLGPWG